MAQVCNVEATSKSQIFAEYLAVDLLANLARKAHKLEFGASDWDGKGLFVFCRESFDHLDHLDHEV